MNAGMTNDNNWQTKLLQQMTKKLAKENFEKKNLLDKMIDQQAAAAGQTKTDGQPVELGLWLVLQQRRLATLLRCMQHYEANTNHHLKFTIFVCFNACNILSTCCRCCCWLLCCPIWTQAKKHKKYLQILQKQHSAKKFKVFQGTWSPNGLGYCNKHMP